MPYRTPANAYVNAAKPLPAIAADRHGRRSVMALTVAAAAFVAFAFDAYVCVPRLAEDDPVAIERDMAYARPDFATPRRYMIMSTDPSDFSAPSDVVLHGRIVLRAHKSPLERIARAPR